MSKKYKKIPQDGPLSKKRKLLLTVVTNVKNLSKTKLKKEKIVKLNNHNDTYYSLTSF